ncbi:MAG: hypothetical protein CBARDCOR_4194 [uncultured Caballeronia sp.]|nr:MAG: hypothetical protein CBARDCOR_4194 [uncultured Caballeronia sp.]
MRYVILTVNHFGVSAVRDRQLIVIKGPFTGSNFMLSVPADQLVWGDIGCGKLYDRQYHTIFGYC